ncbi:MAG TPA: ATP-binding protein, partial [Flavitalea sp.]|nr:ATP-binding protein [Flavitalea sp.]
MHIWLADEHAVPTQIVIPYFDSPHWNSFKKAKANGDDLFVNLLNFEEKNKFYRELFTLVPVPDETLNYYLNCPGLAGSTVLLENIGLYIENFSGIPYTDEENKTLMRFGKVFQQTYTRFLDLQKAEAQARESHIEAALEKVRGKAMAMHNSNDLSVTACMVFTELRKLNITPIRCGVGLLNKDSRKSQLYSTTSTAHHESLSLVGWVMLDKHPVLSNIYEHWLRNEDYFPQLAGEEIKPYYQEILKGLPVAMPESTDGKMEFGSFISISVGCLYTWSAQPYNETEIRILKRFAAIVDLTFRRYIELKKSEASAREAVKQAALDRIRADIASMRTVADLDRIIPLVWNELTILGVPFIRCGVFIMDEIPQKVHSFLSTPDGKAIAGFHISYNTSGPMAPVIDHWRKNEIHTDYWDTDAFKTFATGLVEQGVLTSAEQYLRTMPTQGFHLHFLPFLQGMLYVGNTDQLSDENMALVKLVADAFSTAYARYEDFNKLEAAKEQVDKTLAELRQTQQQLIQSEKMASLGELTAGIAHEIQNPLNFVNNFSDVNKELLAEMIEEIEKGNLEEAKSLATGIAENEHKINHHGKRADSIVKGMLQHSRSSTGQKETADLNALAEEYLKLSYQAFRSKDKLFNTSLEIQLDKTIGNIEMVPQDIGRVLLNLYNNAFYAVHAKKNGFGEEYKPKVEVNTRRHNGMIEITVSDNGTGIPQKIIDRIYHPFFTTKPTG